ncbi:hypothetical protein [Halomonas salipaludis]|nr:hypothetical protein [Halomonas salipaludis]
MQLTKHQASGTVVAHWRDVDSGETVDAEVGEGEPVNRLLTTYPDAQSARAAASAELRRGQRGEQRLDLTLPGDPQLMAEGRLQLEGFREDADGEWLIEQVEHTLSEAGYRCRVKAELPGE